LGGPVAFTFFAARNIYPLPLLQANAYVISVVQSAVLALIGIPLVTLVLRGTPSAIPTTLWFLIAFLPTNLLQRYLLALIQGKSRFLPYGIASLSVQVTYGMAAIVLLALSRRSVDLILGSILVGNVVAIAIAFIALGRPAPWHLPNLSLWRETFAYGIRAHLGNIAPIERLQLDLLVVSAVFGTFSAGLYVVASSVASLPRFLGFAIGMVALPHVAVGGTLKEQMIRAASIFRLAVVILAVVTVLLEATSGFLIPLVYGDKFGASIPLVQVLVVGGMAAALRRTLGDSFRGLGRPILATFSEVAGWAVAAIGLVVLAPRLGVLGAADAVALSFVASLVVAILLAIIVIGMAPTQLLVIRGSDVRTAIVLARQLSRATIVLLPRAPRATRDVRLK
jgi:O-antigen/teichoic acid export membrane protein